MMANANAVAQCWPRHLRETSRGQFERATTSPAFRVFRQPNAYEPWPVFILNLVAAMQFDGTGCALVLRDDKGAVTSLHRAPRGTCVPYVSPEDGSIFYTINQAQPPSAEATGGRQATFGRDQQCLRCHLSWDTLGVPGLSVLTTFPRKSEMDYANGGFVDHYRPIEERWGGWYVTGKKVPARHMGNLPLIMPRPLATPPPARASLEGVFDLDGYLAPYSDIVALMVLEHQAHFSNLVTRATWETRLGETMRIAEAADALVDYMLFVDEAKLTGPIEGSSGFAETFTAAGPKDAKGRSLRELVGLRQPEADK